MASYPMLDGVNDLTSLEMQSARGLVFTPVIGSPSIQDNVTWFTEKPTGSAPANVFKWSGKEGATYDLYAGGERRTYYLIIYDEYGKGIADGYYKDVDGTDPIDNFVAPYSGTYYLYVAWSLKSTADQPEYGLSIYEDIDTIPALAPRYVLRADQATISEGNTLNFDISTVSGSGDMTLSYGVSGVTVADLVNNSLSGSVTLSGGHGRFSISIAADAVTEGPENLTVYVVGGGATPVVTKINDTSVSATQLLVAGTVGDDCFVPSIGRKYLGGAGNDVYVVNANTLTNAIAEIIDTEGFNTIQIVDTTAIVSGTFYQDAMQLQLASGGRLQILGASKFSYQLGANLLAGDGSAPLTYVDFASAIGAHMPLSANPIQETINYQAPKLFAPGGSLTAASNKTFLVSGSKAADVLVPTSGNSYYGQAGNDVYVLSPLTLNSAFSTSIVDYDGEDAIQLVDGMIIASTLFFADAVQFELSTGAKVQVTGATHFKYQARANTASNDNASLLSYSELASLFGASVPANGLPAVPGKPNFLVPTFMASLRADSSSDHASIGDRPTVLEIIELSGVSEMALPSLSP